MTRVTRAAPWAHTFVFSATLSLSACTAPPQPALSLSDATVVSSDVSTDASTDASTDGLSVMSPDVPAGTDPLGFAVDHPGPFLVGYHHWAVTYTPRGTTTPRTLPLHAWYPTVTPHGAHPRYGLIFVDTDSYTDAPAAPPLSPQGYPVHIYSHGHQGFGPTSHFLMRWMASHGWLAVAPDHVGNTLVDTPDPLPAAMFHLRSQDISATLDAIATLNTSSTTFLTGRADVSRVILSGHSFGTHTTWASAGATFDLAAVASRCSINPCTPTDREVFAHGLGDPRIVGIIPMAGSLREEWFGPNGHTTVTMPILAMSGTSDPVGADVQFAHSTGNDLRWINVLGACHQFFALGHCSDIQDSLQGPIVGTYALAFSRAIVLGDNSPTTTALLDGTALPSDRVTFRRRTP